MQQLNSTITTGAPETMLHVGRPNIGSREAFSRRINEMFDRNWLSNRGPFVLEFEEKLAAYLGVRNCVVLCNGTIALELAIKALGLSGEVIVPSLTFVATAHALHSQGITPVFCDIDPKSRCLSPAEVEKRITPRTTGILGVHLYGNPCEVAALQQVADRHNLKLLFDAAHAFGCSYNGRMIGGFGCCEVFSFHATKFFNSFEGGAIATDDDEFAKKIRLMKNFGFAGMDNVISPGTNGKMTEICAAMGLTGLESLDEFLAVNRRNYECYRQVFSSIPGIRLMEFDESESCNYQYIITEITAEYPLTRDGLMTRLHQNNVGARRYFWPGCHQMEPYRTLQPDAGRHLSVTEAVAARVLAFPTGCSVGEREINMIAQLIEQFACEGAGR